MRQRPILTCLGLALLILLGAACQAFSGQDPAATLEANNNNFIAEATNIAVTANAYSTQVMATVQVVENQVVQFNTVNQHLLATVMAGSTPTPRVVAGNADPSTSGMVDDGGNFGETSGQNVDLDGAATQFSQIGTAASVRQSDGCANGLQSQFSLDTDQIYITAYATNLAAGTVMSAEWSLNGTVMVTNGAWNVDQNYSEICVWFFITQDDTAFTPGDWTVRLLANNVPVEPAAAFSIVGQ